MRCVSSRSARWIGKNRWFKSGAIKRREREGPEFAILDLSEEKYENFKETPKEFVNKYKIFSQPVRELKACCSSETTEKKEKASKDPYVVVSLWPGSKAMYASFPSH